MPNTEIHHDLLNTASIGGRNQRNSQRSNSYEHRKRPLLDLAEVHGIARIIGDPCYGEWIVVCSCAGVWMVDNLLCDDTLVKDQAPVWDLGWGGDLDLFDLGFRVGCHGGR